MAIEQSRGTSAAHRLSNKPVAPPYQGTVHTDFRHSSTRFRVVVVLGSGSPSVQREPSGLP